MIKSKFKFPLLLILLVALTPPLARAQGTPSIDANCDGRVDNFDIDAFVFYITFPEQYAERYPGCRPLDNQSPTPIAPTCQALAPEQAVQIEEVQSNTSAFFRRSLNVIRRDIGRLAKPEPKLAKIRSARRAVRDASGNATLLIGRLPKEPQRCNSGACKSVSYDPIALAITKQFAMAESALRSLRSKASRGAAASKKPGRFFKRLVTQKELVTAQLSQLVLNSDEC